MNNFVSHIHFYLMIVILVQNLVMVLLQHMNDYCPPVQHLVTFGSFGH